MRAPSQHRRFVRSRGGVAPLRHRNFALYWLGFAASNTGRWIELTGAVWLVYELTDSPVLLGLLGIARAAPALALGPIAGVLTDRVDHRRLLFTTQGLGLLASLALGLLVVAGAVEVWHVYVQVAVQAAIQSFDAAARQTLFPRLIPRSQLPEAVTLSSTAGRSAGLIGPSIGGIAIAGLGEAAPFLINAMTFPVLMAAVIWMRGVPRLERAATTFRVELTEGLRYILAAPVLSGILKLELVFGIFQINAVIIAIVGREILNVGPEGLGGLLSAPALGALVGVASLVALGHTRRQGRFAVLCTIAYAAALVVFALSRDYLLSLVAIALTGMLDALVTTTRHSVMQLSAPSHMRGRVMANMGTVTRGTSPLAQTQSGILAGAIGAPLAVIAAAAALVIAAGVTARANPHLWRFSREEPVPETPGPRPGEAPPEVPVG